MSHYQTVVMYRKPVHDDLGNRLNLLARQGLQPVGLCFQRRLSFTLKRSSYRSLALRGAVVLHSHVYVSTGRVCKGNHGLDKLGLLRALRLS